MILSRTQTTLLLFVAALFFGFTLLHASWLADKPVGKPRLVADRGPEPIKDARGCFVKANSGYGASQVSPAVGSLQLAVGAKADVIVVRTGLVDGGVGVESAIRSTCADDGDPAIDGPVEAAKALSRPQLIWSADSKIVADLIVSQLTSNDKAALDRSMMMLPENQRSDFAAAHPKFLTFSVTSARKCAGDYRGSLLGTVPKSCTNGVMLLTLDDLGYTLWGWPNRFLQRMAKVNVRVIIAEDVVDGQIKGLSDVTQYGEIADSYNGYIWVDNIQELGPALKR